MAIIKSTNFMARYGSGKVHYRVHKSVPIAILKMCPVISQSLSLSFSSTFVFYMQFPFMFALLPLILLL
jgi:hypothetical protein